MVVAQAFHDAKMPLSPKLLDNVQKFADTVIEEATKLTKAEIEAGAKVEAGEGFRLLPG